ncbi:hypothetical protein E4T52_07888 [Aureobasidium sp. EXF-3400]|nr:hypothetical protein E4T51_06828 [Aureobasidium sp. EXF-12344]KAI4777170.1 hypothetical protein E4T52_07888 [Aureobasidium sp. EXF-3400]
MSAAIGGPATGRFFRAFHAWSRLSNVSHQQRRCFVSTGSLHDANYNKPSYPRTVQSSQKKAATRVRIPQARLERIQQHPTFLQRMHAALDANIQPDGDSNDEGFRLVRIEAPSARVCRYVRALLVRRDDDPRTLDNTVFAEVKGTPKNHPDMEIDLKIDVSAERASLLQENRNELKLRIQDTFSVSLDFLPEREGATTDGMRTIAIAGGRKDVNLAKDFINSLHHELEQATQIQKEQSDEPLRTSPEPSSVSLKSNKSASIKDRYKATMRCVPSSVVVLTTSVSSSTPDIDSLRGMTVSSLTSVTLEPEPIISFSIRGPSRTLDCITAGQPFAVNFLSGYPLGARIADIFSKPHEHPSQPFHAVQNLNLAKVHAQDGDSAPPNIGGKHVPARFTCELLPGKSLEIGDHTVIFARVTGVWKSRSPQSDKVTFLAYAQAGYRTLAQNRIEWPAAKILKPIQSKKSAPSTSEVLTPQPLQTEAEPQETEIFDEDVPVATTKSDAASDDIVDAYWRMALDEDKEDSVLEERAADQRALGEAQKPADHPAADPEDGLPDKPSLQKQDK